MGKSTLLHQLWIRLAANRGFLALKILDFADCGPDPEASDRRSMEEVLSRWLEEVRQQAGAVLALPGRFHPTELHQSVHKQFIEFTGQVCNECRAGRIMVLMVDAFDYLSSEERVSLTALLDVFLHPMDTSNCPTPHNMKVLLARREESKLAEQLVRWDQKVIPLEGLNPESGQTVDQIRRRLEGVLAPDAPPEDDWRTSLDDLIDTVDLGEAEREALIAELRGFLTSSPTINLLLLEERLLHPDIPIGVADCTNCLVDYVACAGLSLEYARAILDFWVDRMDQFGAFGISEYDVNNREHELTALIDAGIVSVGPRGYQFDRGLVTLIHVRKRLLQVN